MSGFSTHQPVFKGGGGPQIICLSKGVNTLCVVGLFLCEKNKNALFSHCSVSTSALSLLYDTPPSPSHSDEHIGEKPGVHQLAQGYFSTYRTEPPTQWLVELRPPRKYYHCLEWIRICLKRVKPPCLVMYLAVTLSAVSLSISKHDKLTSPNKFRYENPDYCWQAPGMQWLMFVLMFICTSVSKMKNLYWERKKLILYLLTLWTMSLEVSPTGT